MENIDSYIQRFEPIVDDNGWVTETPDDYAERMQSGLLHHWPTEVLIEWLHRHAQCLYRYAPLRFERLQFQRTTWELSQIPGREAFDDEEFCDNFMDVDARAESSNDWLATYMIENGTWNTPILLLQNPQNQCRTTVNLRLKSPYHLLEGHRRLSFLNGLREMGRANPQHDIWLVDLAESD